MEKLKTLYEKYNGLLDNFDQGYFKIGEAVDDLVIETISNPKSYNKPLSKKLIDKAVQMYKLYVDFENSVDRDVLFKNKQFTTERALQVLFLWDDLQPLELIRYAEPFCNLSHEAKKELQGIVDLNNRMDLVIQNYQGDMFEVANIYNLQQRKSVAECGRGLKGLAA